MSGLAPLRRLAPLALAALAGACASMDPPAQTENACAIFKQKPDWWRAAKQTERRWDAPPALTLAIIRQESSFTHDARPPRQGGFLFIPGRRPSTAFGYAQALETTWADYTRATGRGGADRDQFDDAADFVGWYLHGSRERLGLAMDDARNHYLAYHEGRGGFERGTHRGKAWLKDAAASVDANTRAYARQIDACESDLNNQGWWPF
jgi:hypothetical protein